MGMTLGTLAGPNAFFMTFSISALTCAGQMPREGVLLPSALSAFSSRAFVYPNPPPPRFTEMLPPSNMFYVPDGESFSLILSTNQSSSFLPKLEQASGSLEMGDLESIIF